MPCTHSVWDNCKGNWQKFYGEFIHCELDMYSSKYGIIYNEYDKLTCHFLVPMRHIMLLLLILSARPGSLLGTLPWKGSRSGRLNYAFEEFLRCKAASMGWSIKWHRVHNVSSQRSRLFVLPMLCSVFVFGSPCRLYFTMYHVAPAPDWIWHTMSLCLLFLSNLLILFQCPRPDTFHLLIISYNRKEHNDPYQPLFCDEQDPYSTPCTTAMNGQIWKLLTTLLC